MDAENQSITLPADLAEQIRSRVENGAYLSSSEVVRAALHLLEERERERERRLDVVRAKIDEALNDPVRLTPEEVRQHLDQLHEETVRSRGR